MKSPKTLTEVVWDDAIEGEEEVVDIRDLRGKAFLCRTHTYGRVYHEDKDVIVLCHYETSLDNVEYVAIPKNWIVSRKDYTVKK